MPTHYKAFLVVISFAVVAFWFARPVFTKFMADDEYIRRRNLWLVLTTSAFMIPNFWAYMALAAILVYRAAKKDKNPVALYMFLLLTIPPLEQPIPGFGIVNYLFPVHHIRLLCLFLIIPAAMGLNKVGIEKSNTERRYKLILPDVCLIAYGCLQVLTYAPFSSITDTTRSLVMMSLDLLLPYYVISRFCTTKERLVEAVAAFTLAVLVLAPIAVFEITKGWLLYDELAAYWRVDVNIGGYLLRGDNVRAIVTSGNSIVLGNFFAVGLGTWLYLVNKTKSSQAWIASAVICAGLISAFSRGPWVGAVVCVFVFFALGPNPAARLFKLSAVTALIVCITIMSPYGSKVVDYLPFVGTVDAGNVSYRQAVNDRALLIIGLNPFFGSPYFSQYMEDLRTGLGIIDFLNVYLSIGMAYGLVTLAAFVIFFFSSMYRSLILISRCRKIDPDTSILGASLVCALMGTLVIIYTASNYLSIPYIYTALAGLLVAFSRLQVNTQPEEYKHFGQRSGSLAYANSLKSSTR